MILSVAVIIEKETLDRLINTNQLRNLWLQPLDVRLDQWREFRIHLENDDYTVIEKLEFINAWWRSMPVVNLTIDPYDCHVFPTLWEIIDEGECCKYSRGLAMAYNMFFIDQEKNVTISRVYDTKFNDEYFVAVWDDQYVLNSLHDAIVTVDIFDEHLQIQESHLISNVIHNEE